MVVESLYNVLFFALAVIGAGRFGLWLMGRHWHWVAKAIVLLIVTSVIWGFLQQMGGGPQKTDLRIVTEILASAGVIFSLEYLFHHVRNGWGRCALVALGGVFLFVTWSDTLDRGMGTLPPAISKVPPAFTPVTSPPSPSPPPGPGPTPTKSNAQLCAEDPPRLPFSTCQKLGY